MYLELKNGLTEILKVPTKNPILIECRNNKLYVGTYTDYHKVIYETTVNHKDFSATIPAEMAKELPEIAFEDFSVKDNFIELKQGNNKTKIATSEENIPLTSLAKGYEKENNASFDGKEFKEAFNYTRHASNDKTLGDIVLRGFHFLVKPQASEVMASNGSILSLVKIHQTNPDFENSEMILLNSDFSKILKLVGDEPVNIGYNEKSVSITYQEEDFTIRAISARTTGNALPYENVVDSTKQSCEYFFVIDKQDFLNNVKQLKVFSADRCSMSFYNTGEFTVSSSGQSGEASRDIKVMSTGKTPEENIEIKLNISNLFSFLVSTKSETVKMSIKDSLSPIFIEDSFGIEILAPLRK